MGEHVHVDDDDPALTAALVPYESREWSEALRLLSPLAEAGNRTAIFKVGCVHDSLGETDTAVAHWALAADHGDAPSANNLGRYWEDVGDIDQAATFFLQAAEAGLPEGMFNYARSLGLAGRVDEEMLWFDRAIAADFGRARLLKTVRLLELGREDEAEACLADGRTAGSRLAYQFSAQRLFDAGEHEQARTLLETMFTLPEDPRDADMRAWGVGLLGICEVLLNEPEKARRSLADAANLGSSHAMWVLAGLAEDDGDENLRLAWRTMALAHGYIPEDE
jgi:TPR repeat protein